MSFTCYLALRIIKSLPSLYCKLTTVGKRCANGLCVFKDQLQWLNGESFTLEVGVKFPCSMVVLFFVPHVKMVWNRFFCDNMCFTKCII